MQEEQHPRPSLKEIQVGQRMVRRHRTGMTTHLHRTFAKTFFEVDLYDSTGDRAHVAPASKSLLPPGNPADSCGAKCRSPSGQTRSGYSQSGGG